MFNLIDYKTLVLIFFLLMGLSVFLYVILDGYDLGVGLLMPFLSDNEKDLALSSIGPFWDANETWLVLGIGLLLVAFPLAHGEILTGLYIPVFIMLLGLIIRGCSFDFRMKSSSDHKKIWNKMFFVGSLVSAMSQGFMLGWWIVGFKMSLLNITFAILIALCLPMAYSLMGSSWLIMKTEGEIQQKAISFMKHSIIGASLGVASVSMFTPFVSETIFNLWFSSINAMLMLPMICGVTFFTMTFLAYKKPKILIKKSYLSFALSIAIFVFAFIGLAYSMFPYLVMDKLTIWDAASAFAPLKIIFIGTIFVVPTILMYTVFVYYVFRGKSQQIGY